MNSKIDVKFALPEFNCLVLRTMIEGGIVSRNPAMVDPYEIWVDKGWDFYHTKKESGHIYAHMNHNKSNTNYSLRVIDSVICKIIDKAISNNNNNNNNNQ